MKIEINRAGTVVIWKRHPNPLDSYTPVSQIKFDYDTEIIAQEIRDNPNNKLMALRIFDLWSHPEIARVMVYQELDKKFKYHFRDLGGYLQGIDEFFVRYETLGLERPSSFEVFIPNGIIPG